MEKERRIKVISVITLIVAVLGLTVAFAVLSANLTINGTAKVDPGTWNIYFDNLTNAKIIGKAKEESAPQIDANNKTEVNNINVVLTQPKDEVEYTVDVFNEGNIDAMVSNINKPQLSSEEEKYVSFTIRYVDGLELGINDLIKAGQRETLVIKIAYKDIESLPDKDLTLHLSFSVDYVQADERANTSHTGSTTTKNFKTYQIGEEVSVGTENFYVLKDNGYSVTMLAKYGLNVGDNLVPGVQEGIQSEKATYDEASEKFYGFVKFADSKYWIDHDKVPKQEYGASFPTNVFDQNSNLYQYVTKYQEYLNNTLDKASATASLLSCEQMQDLGCDITQNVCKISYEFVYSLGYHTGCAAINGNFFYGTPYDKGFADDIGVTDELNVRPVIEINKSDIE